MKHLLMMIPVLLLLLSGCATTDPDSDGDDVPDSLDKCPATPAGVAVNSDGCPIDSDGDGVPDFQDKCLDTPAGAPVDENGCPLDSDGDGVPDYLDECPNTPPGIAVDNRGCALPIVEQELEVIDLPEICRSEVQTSGDGQRLVTGVKPVQFDFDSDELKMEGAATLDCIAQVMDQVKRTITLAGYTCSVGTEEYNQRLSQRRAHAVRDYLLSKGVEENYLDLQWYGEANPSHDNNDLDVRRLNRRVEIMSQN